MNTKAKCLIYLLICAYQVGQIIAPGAQAAEATADWTLTESSLIAALKESSPQLKAQIANQQQARFNDQAKNEEYQWKWITNITHSDSDEKSIASFFPTFGPTYRYETGLHKKIAGGVAVEADIFADQQSTTNDVISDATRTGVNLNLSVDLWKNLFGRVDRAQLTDLRLANEKAKIESKISSHITNLQMRKIYWSLIANAEQTKVTEALLRTSEKQLYDAKRRGQQFIADKAEVSRYRAQVSSRKSTLKAFEYQRDLFIQNLKQELPHLAARHFLIAPIDKNNVNETVNTCLSKISEHTSVPWNNTQVDELLKIIEESYKGKQVLANRYSDIDLQLTSALQISGVDDSYSDSYKDFREEGESGYQVGLKLTVPLGSSHSNAKVALAAADYNRYLMEKNKLVGQVTARHTQVISMIQLLKSSVQNLKDNGDSLEISLRSSQKKFKQARISLNDLINEQDALLNTRLTEIDTKLLIIHTLLDYYQTFTEDPCTVNRVGV